MKTPHLFKSTLVLITCLGLGSLVQAGSEWESLGSSEALLEKAKAIDPDNKVRVVQKRSVNRHLRFEVAGHYGLLNGGDSYIRSQNAGAQLEFHITPHWSVGYRYDQYMNDLTAEGQANLNQTNGAVIKGNQASMPKVDFPLNSQMAALTWYPIYGKLNLFDSHISQFDLYLLAGAGKINLNLGNSSSLTTAGGGAGIWLSQYISARFEIRYQGYKNPIYTDNPQVNQTAMNLSLGFLL